MPPRTVYPHSDVHLSHPEHGLPIPSYDKVQWRSVPGDREVMIMGDGVDEDSGTRHLMALAQPRYMSVQDITTREMDPRTMADALPLWTPRTSSTESQRLRSALDRVLRHDTQDQRQTPEPWQVVKYEEQLHAVREHARQSRQRAEDLENKVADLTRRLEREQSQNGAPQAEPAPPRQLGVEEDRRAALMQEASERIEELTKDALLRDQVREPRQRMRERMRCTRCTEHECVGGRSSAFCIPSTSSTKPFGRHRRRRRSAGKTPRATLNEDARHAGPVLGHVRAPLTGALSGRGAARRQIRTRGAAPCGHGSAAGARRGADRLA